MECYLHTFDTDMDTNKYHSQTKILSSHTGCYINMHLQLRYIFIFTASLGNTCIQWNLLPHVPFPMLLYQQEMLCPREVTSGRSFKWSDYHHQKAITKDRNHYCNNPSCDHALGTSGCQPKPLHRLFERNMGYLEQFIFST